MEHVINIKCDAQCSAPSNQNSEIENKRVIDSVALIHNHTYNLGIFYGVNLNFVTLSTAKLIFMLDSNKLLIA